MPSWISPTRTGRLKPSRLYPVSAFFHIAESHGYIYLGLTTQNTFFEEKRKSNARASAARCSSSSRERTSARMNARELNHTRARFQYAIQVGFMIEFSKSTLVSPSRGAERGLFLSQRPIGMYRMGLMLGWQA